MVDVVGAEPREEPTLQSLDRRVTDLEQGFPAVRRDWDERLDAGLAQAETTAKALVTSKVREWTREADQRMHEVVDPVVVGLARLEASVQTLQGIIEGAIGVRWKGPREPVIAPYTRRERRLQAAKRVALIIAGTLILALTVYNTVLDTLLMRAR